MFRPVRMVISGVVLVGGLWAAFAVDLGGKSFAEHVDTISETPEAQQLVDDTRATINPALAEVRDRVLGEYVEAPTWIATPDAEFGESSARSNTHESAPTPDGDREPVLPGRRSAPIAAHSPRTADTQALEPALPGRR